MSEDTAVGSSFVATIRREVPEFEPVFQARLDEDAEMGCFEAVSAFGSWLLDRLGGAPTASAEVVRGFAVVEAIASDPIALPLRRALVAEFVEVVVEDGSAVHLLGQTCRTFRSG